MPGRRPKPTRLKILSGNPGRRPLNGQEPQPLVAAPLCPAWLGRDGKAKWADLAGQLEPMGLLTAIDGDMLAGYCVAWENLLAARRAIKRQGRTYKHGSLMKEHPAVKQEKDALLFLQQFGARFGLDPSSRSRLHVTPWEEEDPFEKFLKGRKQAEGPRP